MVTYISPGQRLTPTRLNRLGSIGQLVFRATRDAAQTISSDIVATTANALSWDNVQYDDLGGWSAGTPTRYRPTVAGWYLCTGSGSFVSNTTGNVRGVGWLVNGLFPDVSGSRPHVTTMGTSALTAEARSVPFSFNGSTDYIELCPFQNSGGGLATATGSVRPYIAVYYVAPA